MTRTSVTVTLVEEDRAWQLWGGDSLVALGWRQSLVALGGIALGFLAVILLGCSDQAQCPFCFLEERLPGTCPSLLPDPASIHYTINNFHDYSKKEIVDCPKRVSINHRTMNDPAQPCVGSIIPPCKH